MRRDGPSVRLEGAGACGSERLLPLALPVEVALQPAAAWFVASDGWGRPSVLATLTRAAGRLPCCGGVSQAASMTARWLQSS